MAPKSSASISSPYKTGILLVNLGSPKAPTYFAVRRYLKQFLWDPRVVNLPRSIWWFVLNFIILPFRPKRSAANYKKIWTEQGSPLVYLTHNLTEQLKKLFNDEHVLVDYAMRYGQPSIQNKLSLFNEQVIDQLIVIPLYPQYSSTTTASVHDAVFRNLQKWRHVPTVHFISDYYQHPEYIEAIAQSVEDNWQQRNKRGEVLLISFHGIPKKLTDNGDPYFYQCHRTASLIADKLALKPEQWICVFQSRFGKAQWLKPYCVDVLQELPEQGVKSIDVICPGFAVDCLETLEEMAITNQSVFIAAGGEDFNYIPALNDSPAHAHIFNALTANLL